MTERRIISEEGMTLTGMKVNLGKYIGLGCELQIGDAKLQMCGKVQELLDISLPAGKKIRVKRIVVEFEDEK